MLQDKSFCPFPCWHHQAPPPLSCKVVIAFLSHTIPIGLSLCWGLLLLECLVLINEGHFPHPTPNFLSCFTGQNIITCPSLSSLLSYMRSRPWGQTNQGHGWPRVGLCSGSDDPIVAVSWWERVGEWKAEDLTPLKKEPFPSSLRQEERMEIAKASNVQRVGFKGKVVHCANWSLHFFFFQESRKWGLWALQVRVEGRLEKNGNLWNPPKVVLEVHIL